MYHDVSDEVPRLQGGPAHFSVSRAAFAAHLELIQRTTRSGVSIEAAAKSIDQSVAISFDDGDEGQYRHAFPALVDRAMTATFFVTTSWVGKPGYVTWPQLREMKSAGMSIQSHTHTHPFLSELPEHRVREELSISKAELDQHLGQDTSSLGLPGGDPPARRLQQLIPEAGYRFVATSRWGLNHRKRPRAWIRRCTIRGVPDSAWMQRVIAGDSRLRYTRGFGEGVLYYLRAALGPTRYARGRRRVLDVIAAIRG